MDNKFLSRQKTQALIDQIGVKEADGKAFLDGLVAKGYTIEGFNDKPVQEKPSQMSRLGTDLLQRAKTVGEQVKQVGQAEGAVETAAQVAQTPLRVAGALGGAVGDVVGAGLEATKIPEFVARPEVQQALSTTAGMIPGFSAIKQALSGADTVTGGGIEKLKSIVTSPETQQQVSSAITKLEETQPEVAQTIKDVFNSFNLIVGGSAAKPVVKAGVTGLERGARATARGAVKTGQVLKEGISPTPTLGKALEEATVARTAKEIPAFEKAISAIDTTDVKTFADLNKKFKEAIPTISKQVDDELLKDTTVYKIEDLLIPQVTKSGKEIKTDYITRALDGLDDLYTKLGDDVAKADVQDLMAKAQSQGLTRKEVNDLARQYNVEYGNKAFTATGDIKQGFNADVYESTRKGLKDIARSGLGGEQARALDESLSAIYDAQRLAERNANAVQAMKTRIEEKGWIGKGIRGAFDISDLLTGGAVRSLRDTVLARGNAQKLQNVLELENKLKKNLEVINKAMKAKTEAKAVEILNTLPKEKGIIGTAIDNLKDPKMRQGGYIRNPLAKKELPVQKSSSLNDSTDLIQEAKKYKTAEEFVSSKPEMLLIGEQNGFKKSIQGGIVQKIGDKQTRIYKNPKGDYVASRMFEYDTPLLKAQGVRDSSGTEVVYKSLDEAIASEKEWIGNNTQNITKSQLEEIWKQAQGTLPKKQK